MDQNRLVQGQLESISSERAPIFNALSNKWASKTSDRAGPGPTKNLDLSPDRAVREPSGPWIPGRDENYWYYFRAKMISMEVTMKKTMPKTTSILTSMTMMLSMIKICNVIFPAYNL